jgi:hypothetical protein
LLNIDLTPPALRNPLDAAVPLHAIAHLPVLQPTIPHIKPGASTRPPTAAMDAIPITKKLIAFGSKKIYL